jgi:hypothetical protein
MLVSLLLTTMASARNEGAADFAHGVCRHFALLLASGWGAQQPPALPPSSKYASYPVLDGVPAKVTALKHLHPKAVLEAFQEVSGAGRGGRRRAGRAGSSPGGCTTHVEPSGA